LGNGLAERLGDVFLTDHIAEALGAVFAGYDLITHLRSG
jgi:hypothetical protein